MSHLSDAQLNDYIDGELPRRSRADLERRVTECEECQRRLASLQFLEAQVGRIDDPEPRSELKARLVENLRRREALRVVDARSRSARHLLSGVPRWAVAASVTAILVAAGVVLVPDIAADSSELVFAPAEPGPGGVVEIEYRSDGRFAGQAELQLRAQYRRVGDRPYAVRSEDVATLIRLGGSRVFEGRVRVPDSVVYAVFAVEDPQGQVVDSRGHAGWELLVHADGVPTYAALVQKRQHLLGEDWEGALRTQEQAVALYPDVPAAWHVLSSLLRELGGSRLPDTTLTMLREQYDRLGKMFDGPGASGADLSAMAFFSAILFGFGSEESNGWLQRLYVEAPSHPDAMQFRVRELVGQQGTRSTRAILQDLDSLWQPDEPVHLLLAEAGVLLSVGLGDVTELEKWTERLMRLDPSVAVGVGTALAQHPGLWEEGVDRLRRELSRVDSMGGERRPLYRTVNEQRRWDDRERAMVHAAIGKTLFSNGRLTEAMPYLDSAVAVAWDVSLFLKAAEAKLAASNVSVAVDMLARVRVDPSVDPSLADSAEHEALAVMDEERWEQALGVARREMMDRTLLESTTRTVQRELRFLDPRGDTRTLDELRAGRVTVVAYWSRFCVPAITVLPFLRRTLDRVEAMGASSIVIVSEPNSPELRGFLDARNVELPMVYDAWGESKPAFNAWSTPLYYVLDHEGRIRFEHSRLEDIPRQVAALQELARNPLVTP